ncbi:MAG: Co2+/Mg2+ efflux protein ApaG [Acidobacteriota bacterium]
MTIYSATTADITVHVHSMFLERHSAPINHKFVFAYFIRIENNGSDTVQLLRRHWYIAQADTDVVEEVEGEGVVGRQPIIQPNDAHEYNSFCSLESFDGSMEGTYRFRRENGEEFDVAIPRFQLRAYAN